MDTLMSYVAFFTLVGQIFAGDFIGKTRVTDNLFSVLEKGNFRLTCTATHEDEKPQLRWYFMSLKYARTNLTNFANGQGSGKTGRSTLWRTNARPHMSGDYFCEARVDRIIQTSAGVSIAVLTEALKPRVEITKFQKNGKIMLKCAVVPQGLGDLMWRHDGDRLEFEKRTQFLELDPPSRTEEYECYGNLTIASFMFFPSSAYATAAAGWSKITSQAIFLPMCIFTLINSLSF